LGVEPQPVPPVYAPEVVSEVILRAAQRPLREFIAGGSGAKLSAARFVPRLADLYMQRWTFGSQRTDVPTNGRADNLYTPLADDGGERGRNWTGHVRGSSVYTKAVLHPALTSHHRSEWGGRISGPACGNAQNDQVTPPMKNGVRTQTLHIPRPPGGLH
jgi:hypothetical protein